MQVIETTGIATPLPVSKPASMCNESPFSNSSMLSKLFQHSNILKFMILLAGSSYIQAQSESPSIAEKISADAVKTKSEVGFSVSSGFDYSTGKYGLNEKTEIYVGYLTGKCTYGDLTTRIYVPYESISSPSSVTIVNGRPVATGGVRNSGLTQAQVLRQSGLTLAQFLALTAKQKQAVVDAAVKALLGSTATSTSTTTAKNKNAGVGDVSVSADYDIYSDKESGTYISLTGGVKLATGDADKGLGSGKADYNVSADFYKRIGDFAPYVSFGYSFVGKPADSDLKNYYSASFGSSYAITSSTNIDLAFSTTGRSSTSSGVDNELSLGLSQDLGDSWNLDIHGLLGVSASAPDFGAGIRLRLLF